MNRFEPTDTALFIENRKRFSTLLQTNSIALFNANDVQPSNADGIRSFIQNCDLYYLSGINQEETILVLFPDCKTEEHREILFLKESNELMATWEGHKYSQQEATATSGIKKIYWLQQFETIFNALTCECENIYLNSNEHQRAIVEVETRDARFINWCKNRHPLHSYKRSAPLIYSLRGIKSTPEIELITKATKITEDGYRRVLNFIQPGVKEYEIEAEFVHEFVRQGSRGFAYSPIIGTGINACVLHYIDNNAVCKDGDVILLDVAAEYGNYNSDITRSFPVNGKFTKRQKEVYHAVLRALRQATKLLTCGNTLTAYNKEVDALMEEELIGLKLLDKNEIKKQDPEKPLYKKYFMHGTAHHLGLDVHDVGIKQQPLAEGMVFTCEPGIYIREENLGIRLENDILITAKGPQVIGNIPIETEEIEDLMARQQFIKTDTHRLNTRYNIQRTN